MASQHNAMHGTRCLLARCIGCSGRGRKAWRDLLLARRMRRSMHAGRRSGGTCPQSFLRILRGLRACIFCTFSHACVCVCTGEGIYTWTRTRARIVRAQIQPLITDFHAEIMTRDSPFYGRQRARPRARILMPPTSRSVVNSVRMHACTFSHACVCVCAHIRMHAYVYVFAHACVCVFSHLRMHAHLVHLVRYLQPSLATTSSCLV